MQVFLYGTLCHPPLLRAVLGRDVARMPARMPGHVLRVAEGLETPLLIPDPAGSVEGLLTAELDAASLARLDFYENLFGYRVEEAGVVAGTGPKAARLYRPDPGAAAPGGDWSLAAWARRWGPAVTATAEHLMALGGELPPDAVARRYHQMLVHGASRARAAAEPAPARVRRAMQPGDIAQEAIRQPYAHFFSVEEYDLRFRRFSGEMSDTVNRAVFISGDAATVLPYDPVRDRVLVIEQFRPGPYARGAANPWVLEPVAGRIDPEETPEETARREAMEEAGIPVRDLHLVGRYYPTPGAKSEFLHSYIGIADLPDGAAGIGGMLTEDEDIRGHILPFGTFLDVAKGPEGGVGPLLLSALWLELHRPRLRAAAGQGA